MVEHSSDENAETFKLAEEVADMEIVEELESNDKGQVYWSSGPEFSCNLQKV